jgi:cobyrinic acid a,c-diamide synthase
MVTIPRLVIAAPGSAHGKTSVTTGLLAALRSRGMTVSPHKVGPDYIDPGYHALAAGRVGRNLDPWLVGEERIAPMFVHGAMTPTPADIAVVEGVMGLFDGVADRPGFASTAHVASLLAAPVVLVVDAAAVGRSVAALVHGFVTFDPTVRIGGVIFNRVGTDRHRRILRDALDETGVPMLGAIARHEGLQTPSRHLGLIPAAERSAEARRTVSDLGQVVGAAVDLDRVVALARTAPDLEVEEWTPPATAAPGPRPVIALAGGPAFTFSYAETAELLDAAGADVVTFDPIADPELPAGTAGLVIGGGFPEIHAEALSSNVVLRHQIVDLVAAGAPVAAECAGLLYLASALDGAPMCGVFDATAQMTKRLTIGYREAVAASDSPLVVAGTRLRGHEFHRTVCAPSHGDHAAWVWSVTGDVELPTRVTEGFVTGPTSNVHASYLHLNWAGNPDIAARFVRAAASARRAAHAPAPGVRQ